MCILQLYKNIDKFMTLTFQEKNPNNNIQNILDLHVFGLWEESGEHANSTQVGIKPTTLLL